MIKIAGIGSRATPAEICAEMTKIGAWIRGQEFVCRSGHAQAADYAFEQGALEATEVFLPWKNFGKDLPMLGQPIIITDKAVIEKLNALVDKYHPAPHALSHGARLLHSRNGCQILGRNADDPVDAVVCWAPKGKGGTGQAIRCALDLNIPILSMSDDPELATAEAVIARLQKIADEKAKKGI